jgi:hypothetical protein
MTEEIFYRLLHNTLSARSKKKKKPRKKTLNFFSSPLFSLTPEDQAKLSRRPSSSQAARPS